MKVNYVKDEIDPRSLKLMIGLIALFLAVVTSLLTNEKILSISASYHYDGLARDIFVGCLFAIASFLIAYNGQEPEKEALLSKIAAFAALGVALFPCGCDLDRQILFNMGNTCISRDINKVFSVIHTLSAAVMFLILAVFCRIFYKRAKIKEMQGNHKAKRRSYIYAVCGVAIVLSILIMLIDHLLSDRLSNAYPALVFFCEGVGLLAFGISWLTSSKVVPFTTMEGEKLSLFK